ncbi:odorant receptor 22a-like isoform X2 [Bradysia coprophila]|uniref:odorant receptor 22a-like isoform X2 n=1 Tax=Bradysia coprophila TaxID=38358 RepID=UPI00187DD9A6|nr:odorant receptor 22a-like isoform X2 [Bradysia coprophila]
MHSIGIHQVIILLISLFYWMGIWHRNDIPTTRQIKIKLFYWIYYSLLICSLTVGAIKSKSMDEAIFIAQISIMTSILAVKFWILIWKQKQILELINRVCAISYRNDEDLSFFNNKMEKFIKFVVTFLSSAFIMCSCAIIIVPFVGSEKKLFVSIAFPLDYRNDAIAFWIAHIFIATQSYLSVLIVSTSVLIWYLMFHCSLRYEILGREIRNMGSDVVNGKMPQKEKDKKFSQDLTASIEAHVHLKELIEAVASFTSTLFLIQFATSAVCICGSVYCLAFDIGGNFVERLIHLYTLIYHIAELFMITNFGNEIMLSSSRLAYCLFESDWIGRPQSTIKSIIVFTEYLKQAHVLLIARVYPLTLETFIRVANCLIRMVCKVFLRSVFVTDFKVSLQFFQHFEKRAEVNFEGT